MMWDRRRPVRMHEKVTPARLALEAEVGSGGDVAPAH